MIDLHLTDDGDFAVASNGDIAVTVTPQEQIRQQSNLRLATQAGDFVVYPRIGASLQDLVGLPNSPSTGDYGQRKIMKALTYDRFLISMRPQVEATPTRYDTIQFKVFIPYGHRESIRLTLEQLLI